jgi:hypothetical protein
LALVVNLVIGRLLAMATALKITVSFTRSGVILPTPFSFGLSNLGLSRLTGTLDEGGITNTAKLGAKEQTDKALADLGPNLNQYALFGIVGSMPSEKAHHCLSYSLG